MSEQDLNAVLGYIRRLGEGADSIRESDRLLLRRYSETGDQAAFEVLLHRHGLHVLNVCRRLLLHAQDAEDAFQAVFLVLARKAGSVHWHDSIASWLYEVACRVAAEARGRQARLRAREKQMEDMPDCAAPTSSDSPEWIALLDEEMQQLPEKYRAPLVLCCLEGRSREEAAVLLGWTEGSVKGRLERGRELLRRRLARRGVTLAGVLTPALLGVDSAQAATVEALSRQTLQLIGSFKVGLATGPSVQLANVILSAMFGAKLRSLGAILLVLLLGTGGVVALTLTNRTHDPIEKRVNVVPENTPPPERPTRRLSPLPDQNTLKESEGIFRHTDAVRSVAFLPTTPPRFASVSFDESACVWDLRGYSFRRWITYARATALAISPDCKLVVTGTEAGELMGWNMGDSKERFARLTHHRNCNGLTFTSNGSLLASANQSGEITIHVGEDGRLLRRCVGHKGPVWGVTSSTDGKRLYSVGADGTLRVWDPTTGKALQVLGKHDDEAKAVACSRDGKYVASYGLDGMVRVWATDTGKATHTLDAGPGDVVCFAADSLSLITAAHDRELNFWSLDTGNRVNVLIGHEDRVTSLALSADGQRLVSGDQGGVVRVWNLSKLKK